MHGLTCATKPEAGRTGRLKTIAAIFAAALTLAGCNSAPKAPGSGNPVQSGPTQKIHLVWKQATNEWKVKLNSGGEENPNTAKTTLGNGIGPTMFEVDIQGPTTVSFKDSGGLSVWTGSKSAPQAGINSTQILGPIITKQGNLIFWDLNQGGPVILNYSLHFNSGPSVDPIIDNGGGNVL
jgi:predicted small secreted protein